MPPNKVTTPLVVLASLLVAMVLRILPWPVEWFVYNPDWMLLILIYWAMAIPDRVGVGYAWCLGLLGDVLTGRMLGQHALAYSVVVFICVKWHVRFRAYPVYQQTLFVFLLLLFDQLLIFLTQNNKAASSLGIVYWLPPVVGALLWPTILPALRQVRWHFHIS